MAQPPVFHDEDDDFRPGGARGYGGAGGYGGGYGGAYDGSNSISPGGYGAYSDGSHGTYNQAPLAHESYGMREIAPGELYSPDPYASHAGGYAAGAAAGGAMAGVGVARARSQRDAGGYGAALNEGAAPYPAFAGPSPPPQPIAHPYGSAPSPYDAQASGGALQRNKSLAQSHEGEIVYPADPYANTGSYAAYAAGSSQVQPQQQQQQQQGRQAAAREEEDMADAYGGYVVQDETDVQGYYAQQGYGGATANTYPPQQQPAYQQSSSPSGYPQTGNSPAQGAYGGQQQGQISPYNARFPNPYDDEDDVEGRDGPRVLKVANQ